MNRNNNKFIKKENCRRVLFLWIALWVLCIVILKISTMQVFAYENGEYEIEVELRGGSGKASVESPTLLWITDKEEMNAQIRFSSPYYDYLILDGIRYEPINTEGNSLFEIPISQLDQEIAILADTTAMSQPHEIAYTLYFDSTSIAEYSNKAEQSPDEETGREAESSTDKETESSFPVRELPGLSYIGRLSLSYATCFAADYYEGGYILLSIVNEDPFLLIPEGQTVPADLPAEIHILQQPLDRIYLVATSAMDFFDALDALDTIRLSGTNAEGWYIAAAKERMQSGEILFAGKYSAPDYETILSSGCDLAIESTMIYHNPEVREELESLGIPVLVEHSSYEENPLGRLEWIRFYGILTGKEEEAAALYQDQLEKLSQLTATGQTGKTVCFFSINSSKTANVRKSTDYIAKMIEMAGGTYIFSNLGAGENALSTVNMQMEEFYAGAKDADILIYNSTIEGKPSSITDLLGKSELLADFKAVREGQVYATTENFFQKTMGLADFILDLHQILTQQEPVGLCYLEHLNG